MNRIFFLFALIISYSICFAQNRTKEYILEEFPQNSHTNLYSKLEVIDGREVKSNLGIVQVGAFNAKAQVIAKTPLEEQIQQQFYKSFKADKEGRELLLLIKKFSIAELTRSFSESGYFDFRAMLFVKNSEDSYSQLAVIDTSFVTKGVDVTKSILRNSSKIIAEFLANNLSNQNAETDQYSLVDIQNLDDIEKNKIPLYALDTLKDGIYLSYEEFKNQIPTGGQALFKGNDINNGFFTLNEKGKLKKRSAKTCYAIVIYGGTYISSLNEFYPLNREGNDFVFVGYSKETASASDVVAASVAFGAIGGMIAASASSAQALYKIKIDCYNGAFIKLERIGN